MPHELIQLETLFSDPDRLQPLLSPDGQHLAYIAPYNGVLNIWIRSLEPGSDARPLTKETDRGIDLNGGYFWSYNCEQVVFRRDVGGAEQFGFFAIDIYTGQETRLSPEFDKDGMRVQARGKGLILNLNAEPSKPDEIILAINSRDQHIHDLYLVNTRTGATTLLKESAPNIRSWVIDRELNVRGCLRSEPDGTLVLLVRNSVNEEFTELLRWEHEDCPPSRPLGFTPDGKGIYLIDSAGRDTGVLTQMDIASSEKHILAEVDGYDVGKMTCSALNSGIEVDYRILAQTGEGSFFVTSRTLDDSMWTVGYVSDDRPPRHYLYHRSDMLLEFLFNSHAVLDDIPLVPMQSIRYVARDGLIIHGHLTLPKNRQAKGPLVLRVHGGPQARDYWGFDPEVQWLANRGYTCLQVNYRGSTGYGKAFMNAGDREWGGKIQDDLADAVNWAVEQGIADPARIAIYGASFGGYTALCGAAFTPNLYCAAISVCGPCNLLTHRGLEPPYWERRRAQNDRRVGRLPRYSSGERVGEPKAEADWTDDDRADIEFLRSRSPLFRADDVQVPVLIAHGANDPRVTRHESDQFVEALRTNGLRVEYLLYEDEGHYLAQPENRLDFYRHAEHFLASSFGSSPGQ
jgi:acetyl esterase/lipase